jgi:4-hydroxybenzoate polyprenyltransferase
MTSKSDLPLVVDLDGSLIKSDVLLESATIFLIQNPLNLIRLFSWGLRGRATLKQELASRVPIEAELLPYNPEILDFLHGMASSGRRIVLATASNHIPAQAVADHLGIFTEVVASDAVTNLKSSAKAAALVQRFGVRGFDYLGNDEADFAVWDVAAHSYVVSESSRIRARAGHGSPTVRVFPSGRSVLPLPALVRAMRPHQWVKNLLILLPLLTSHQLGNLAAVISALVAFVVFSLAASSVYLLNDLSDISSDRRHQVKRTRPFAAGTVGLTWGWFSWPILLGVAFALATAALPPNFVLALLAYSILTIAYSFGLKRVVIVDVVTLAGLYTLRVLAGAAAIGVDLSFWTLAFSLFFFLSLALVKRFSELKAARAQEHSGAISGRGYFHEDLEVVASLGAASGLASALVMALYVNDENTAVLYNSPAWLWLAVPLMIFWISRVWLITHRGLMHHDPIVFAIRDKTSYAVVAGFAVAFILALVGA